MSLLIRPARKTITLDVEPTDTLWDIKMKIQGKKDIPANQQILVFAGNDIEDRHTLAHYNIQNETTLRLTIRKRQNGDV